MGLPGRSFTPPWSSWLSFGLFVGLPGSLLGGTFKEMKVYECVPRTHLATTGGKLIGIVWIDINKGDSVNPNV